MHFKNNITDKLLLRNIDSIIAGLLGAILVICFTNHGGIGISPDSIYYLSTAEHIIEGKGLFQFDDLPLIMFPAGYPFFLSVIISISQLKIEENAVIINCCLFAIFIFLSGYLMNFFIENNIWYKRAILSYLILSPCLIEVYTMLWSETLFLVCIIIFFVATKYYLENRNGWSLFILGLIVMCACVIRYAGVSLLFTGLLLFIYERDSWKKKIVRITCFSSLSLILLLSNLFRNFSLSETFTGLRQKGNFNLIQHLISVGETFYTWFPIGNPINHNSIFYSLVILFISLLFFSFGMFSKSSYGKSYEFISTTFLLVYTSFIIFISTISKFEQINNRLLSPIYLPFIWLLTFKIPSLIHFPKSKSAKTIVIVLFLILYGFYQFFQVKTDYFNLSDATEAGIGGYSEDIWKSSETIRYIKLHPDLFSRNRKVYSNAAHAIYYFTRKSCLLIPEKTHSKKLGSLYGDSNFVLVWFNNEVNEELVDIQTLQQKRKLKIIDSLSDGKVYNCLPN